MREKTKARLDLLRRRGYPGVAPLWAEYLDPEELCDAIGERTEPWAPLLRARAYLRLGDTGLAEKELASLHCLPPGLDKMKESLRALLYATAAEKAERSRSALADWLENVEKWRARGA